MRPRTGEGRLVGRSAELQVIRQRLARSRAGRCEIVVIEGEPGIGKSRLLNEVLADAVDTRVFAADADPLDQARPFGSLTDALDCGRTSPDPMRSQISRLIDNGAAEFRVVERVTELIERLGLEGPLIVAVDDLQWADPATVICLRFATRHLADLPVAFLVALRRLPRGDELGRFVDASIREGAEHCHLGPLDEASLVGLVEDHLGRPPGPRLRTLLGRVGGNPFYAIELVDALDAEHRPGVGGGDRVETEAARLPTGFRINLLRYLQFLTPPSLALLRKAAVLGTRFPLTDLAAVVGEPPHNLISIIDEAERVGILTGSGEDIVFRHDLLRDAIYDDMPVPVRRSLHLEAGRALAGTNTPPDRVAQHFLIGAQPGDHDAIDWLVAAGTTAANHATRAELLTRAVELLPKKDRRLAALGAEAVVAFTRAGLPAKSEALADQLRPRLDDRGEAQLAMAMVAGFTSRGDPVRVLDHVVRANRLRSHLEPAQRADLIGYQATALLLIGSAEKGTALATEAVQAGKKANAPMAVVLGHAALSWAALCKGKGREAVTAAQNAIAAQSDDARQASPEINLQIALLQEDRIAEAEEVFRAAYDRRAQEGHVTAQAALSLQHALALLYGGRLDDARAEAEASLRLSEVEGTPTSNTPPARAVMARVALHRGALAEAQAVIGPAPATALVGALHFWAAALIREAGGDLPSAHDLLLTMWHGLDELRYFAIWVFTGPDLCRISVHLGDRASAGSVAEVVATGAAGSDAPSAAGAALRCRGLVHGDPEAMLAAIAAYQRGPRVLDTAATREEAADMLATAEAVAQLTAALETYEQAGATGDAARVRAALRARGVRHGVRGARRRPATGWESLTPAEREVVQLACDGLTSRQIGGRLYISNLTVGSHLRSVYRKLGINSRVQLATEAAKHRNPP